MKSFLRTAFRNLAFLSICFSTFSSAYAGSNPVVDTLKKTPVSIFTYGLSNLKQDFTATFMSEKPLPEVMFSAPLSGRIADTARVDYSEKNDTFKLYLLKIYALDSGVTPDEACTQAMAAVRKYAGVDPLTGKPEDMESSYLTSYFFTRTSPIPDAANKSIELDKQFAIHYVAKTQRETDYFLCVGKLLDNSYKISKLKDAKSTSTEQ